MRRPTCFLPGIILLATIAVAQGQQQSQQRGPSTPEERQRFLTFAHKFEQAPLDKNLQSEKEWALMWLIQVPDVNVSICAAALGNFLKSKYKYSGEIIAEQTFASGVFVLEHPEKADDKLAQYVAAAEGALNAYKAILQIHPDAKSKDLDQLLEKQAQGQLAEFERQSTQKSCK